jgi:peptidoglycan-associated lipoprotein
MRKNDWLAFAMVMILTAACFTISCAKEVTQSQPSQPPAPEAQNAQVKPAEESQPAETPQAAVGSGEAGRSAFMDEKIYFEFDSALLSGQARQILIGKADYLRSNSNLTVTVQGHCDERGTEAYNMALGQRRAESVKTFLVDLGILTDRLSTISYGEEQPAVPGSNESAWGQNRRVQFVID